MLRPELFLTPTLLNYVLLVAAVILSVQGIIFFEILNRKPHLINRINGTAVGTICGSLLGVIIVCGTAYLFMTTFFYCVRWAKPLIVKIAWIIFFFGTAPLGSAIYCLAVILPGWHKQIFGKLP